MEVVKMQRKSLSRVEHHQVNGSDVVIVVMLRPGFFWKTAFGEFYYIS